MCVVGIKRKLNKCIHKSLFLYICHFNSVCVCDTLLLYYVNDGVNIVLHLINPISGNHMYNIIITEIIIFT